MFIELTEITNFHSSATRRVWINAHHIVALRRFDKFWREYASPSGRYEDRTTEVTELRFPGPTSGDEDDGSIYVVEMPEEIFAAIGAQTITINMENNYGPRKTEDQSYS